MKLAKAHGLGNDFVLVPEAELRDPSAGWARLLCDRRRGVGADGLIVYAVAGDRVRMRLFNADGSEAEMSGNGVRCLAGYVASRGLGPRRLVVETAAGPRLATVELIDGSRMRVRVELGRPILASAAIPVDLDPPTDTVVDHDLGAGQDAVRITATSLGNPHCAVFVDQAPDDAVVARLGAALEVHPFFPHRTNVEFVLVEGPDCLRVRFWERGVGPTRASGTGAASAVVAALVSGRCTHREVRVVCDGGTLDVSWPADGPVSQLGDAEIVLEGASDLSI